MLVLYPIFFRCILFGPINYSIKEQIKDIAPGFLVGISMAIIVYLIGLVPFNWYISLLLHISRCKICNSCLLIV